MRGILVGIDGSGHSTKALEWAAHEAAARKVPLTVLTVHQIIAGYLSPAMGYPVYVAPQGGDAELAEQARQEAQQEVDKVIGQLDEAFRPASVTVLGVSGLPADELLTAGAEADMIVVGSRGRGGFRRLLLGSVASQVTHHAHVPVVVIPAEAA